MESGRPEQPQPLGVASLHGIFREGERWDPRPVAAWALHVGLQVGPVAAGVVAGLLAAWLMPETSGIAVVVWWVAVVAIGQAVLHTVRNQTKLLHPLPGLLATSLVFPDQAPSRLATARRCADIDALRTEGEEIAEAGLPKSVDEALVGAVVASAALRQRDPDGQRRLDDLRVVTEQLADELQLDRIAREKLRWSVLLHDVGMLGVSSATGHHDESTDEAELQLIKRHATEGERILAPLSRWLGDAVITAGQHHENWNGSGYPRALYGQQIGISARIIAVANGFVDQTLRPSGGEAPSSPLAALATLTAEAGTRFDPTVIGALGRCAAARSARTPHRGIGLSARMPLLADRWAAAAPRTRLVAGRAGSGVLTVAVVLALSALSSGDGQPETPQELALDEAPVSVVVPDIAVMAEVPDLSGGDFVTDNVPAATSTVPPAFVGVAPDLVAPAVPAESVTDPSTEAAQATAATETTSAQTTAAVPATTLAAKRPAPVDIAADLNSAPTVPTTRPVTTTRPTTTAPPTTTSPTTTRPTTTPSTTAPNTTRVGPTSTIARTTTTRVTLPPSTVPAPTAAPTTPPPTAPPTTAEVPVPTTPAPMATPTPMVSEALVPTPTTPGSTKTASPA